MSTINNSYLNQTPPTSQTQSGAGAAPSGDGINWPYNTNSSPTQAQLEAQFGINWNSNPPPSAAQIEQAYEKLLNWIEQNPGSYNGDLMFLQMTVDIGMHMSSLPQSEQSQLSQFLSNQLGSSSGLFISNILKDAAEAAAVSQSTLAGGESAANSFLNQIISALQGAQGYGSPFTDLYNAATTEQGGINAWCEANFKTFVDPVTGQSNSTWINPTTGQPIDFNDFTNNAAYNLGITFIDPSNNNNVQNNQEIDDVINAYYESQIQRLMAEFKNDPGALLIALMSLINQRDEDNGAAVNGYANTLGVLSTANGYLQKMLADLTSKTPGSIADFFSTLKQLQTLASQDPSLQGVIGSLTGAIGTINGQKLPPQALSWTVQAGYYNFPAGTEIIYNGKPTTVSGEVYLSGGTISISKADNPTGGFNFGELAAMGDTNDIQSAMGGWSTATMSNFESGVTGLEGVFNGASSTIQQQLQNMIQQMTATENFEQQAYTSISSQEEFITQQMASAGS